jgi:hypothetical protein
LLLLLSACHPHVVSAKVASCRRSGTCSSPSDC